MSDDATKFDAGGFPPIAPIPYTLAPDECVIVRLGATWRCARNHDCPGDGWWEPYSGNEDHGA